MNSRRRSSRLLRLAVGAAVCSCSCAAMVDVADNLVVTSDYKCLGASVTDRNVQIESCTGKQKQIWSREGQSLRNMETDLCLSVNQGSGAVFQKECVGDSDKEQVFLNMRSLILAGGEFCMARSGTQQQCKSMCLATADNGVNVIATVPAPNTGCVYQESSGTTYNKKMQLKPIMEVPSMKGEWKPGSEGGECTKKCGGGLHSVEYVCENKNFDFTYCELSEKPPGEQMACNEQRCEDWTEFGVCSSTDCSTKGYRARGCKNSNADGYCPGKDYEECYPEGCEVAEGDARTELEAPPALPAGRLIVAVDGSKWTDYDDCSNNCGRGTQTAICAVEASRLAGHECAMFEHTRSCQSNTRPGCTYVIEPDADGEWSEWSQCCGNEPQRRTCEGQSGLGSPCPEGAEGSERTCQSGLACGQQSGSSSAGAAGTTEQDRIVAAVVANTNAAVMNTPQTNAMTGGMQSSGSIGSIATTGRTEEDSIDKVVGTAQPNVNSGGFSTFNSNGGFGTAGYTPFTPSTSTSNFGAAGISYNPTSSFGSTTSNGFTSNGFSSTPSTSFGSTSSTGFGSTSSTGFGSTSSTGFGSTSSNGFSSGPSSFGSTSNSGFTSFNSGSGTSTDPFAYNPFARRRRNTANPFEEERRSLGLETEDESISRNLLTRFYSLLDKFQV